MLKKTMTTKECLHRFCSDCIITALRSGNKECPTCRKKLVSKRSLRPDPNFDCLISKIYPSRDEYEKHQEKVLAKFNKSHSQQALVNSITEGIKLQSQNRPQRVRKGQDEAGNSQNGIDGARDVSSSQGESTRQSSNPPSARSTPSPVPSHSSSTSKPTKRARSVMTTSEKSEDSESNSEMDAQTEGGDSNADTEDGTDGGDEIELVFKPHPTEMNGENILMKALKENTVRYLKTTSNATVDHLSKYLAMRLSLDAQLAEPTFKTLTFSIYIAPMPLQLVVLSGNQTLQQVNEKFWKVRNVNKPLEMFYSCKS